jgi:hypothetical protein
VGTLDGVVNPKVLDLIAGSVPDLCDQESSLHFPCVKWGSRHPGKEGKRGACQRASYCMWVGGQNYQIFVCSLTNVLVFVVICLFSFGVPGLSHQANVHLFICLSLFTL